MILTILMEEKQLNFSRPLLSVRRGSSITAPPENRRKDDNVHTSLPPLPFYKSDLKSGPIRNPGVVPFKWERMPGKPKDENKSRNGTIVYRPPTPKLPPGRITNKMQKQTDEVPRDSPTSSSRCRAEINSHSAKNLAQEKLFSEVEGSEKEEEKETSSSEDENVTFVDARETLSRTESFFNCSVSGVSGLDGPESSGAFADPQTQDFMMGRFLPAAKAMASEAPLFASRRLPAAREQASPKTKMIKWKKQSPEDYTNADTYHHNINGEENDREEEEDESDGPEDLSVKLCGLLPKFCMLSPLPGMRNHVEVISSARSVRTRPAYTGACKNKENKVEPKSHRSGMKRIAHQHAPVPLHEPSLNGQLGRNGLVQEKDASLQLFLDKEKQMLGLPKLDVAHLDTEGIKALANPAIEKTVYVDSERIVEPRHSNSSSSESRGRNPSVDYSLQDMKSLCSKSSETTDSSAVTASEKSSKDVSEDMKKLQKENHGFINVSVDVKQPKAAVKSMKDSDCNSPLALTPLLPKSPSESWLSRTLPSMGSKNPSSKSYLVNHAFRSSPMDPKRERLLHASNVQSMHFQTAGELAPIYEN